MKNHFKVFICVVVLNLLVASTVYGARTQFFTSVMDLPLIPGFTELKNARTVFNKPNGRIIETQASGIMTKKKAKDFYQQTLPQLGWEAIGDERYVREEELLELKFLKKAEKITIYVTLKPTKG